MVTIKELKMIREREAKKLQAEKGLERQKEKIILDIKRIRRSRMQDRMEGKQKANQALQNIKKTGKKVGSAIISFLQDVRDRS